MAWKPTGPDPTTQFTDPEYQTITFGRTQFVHIEHRWDIHFCLVDIQALQMDPSSGAPTMRPLVMESLTQLGVIDIVLHASWFCALLY